MTTHAGPAGRAGNTPGRHRHRTDLLEPTVTSNPTPDLCPNCQHPHHLPGTECQTPVNHGPNRFHLCLCLARPGAALPCPPQMTCQGGTLGYADIWYLQRGHTLTSEDGEISPEVLGLASVGFPTPDPEAAPAVVSSPPATDRATVYRELADRQTQLAVADDLDRRRDLAAARRQLVKELRRMADEAQQPEPENGCAHCGSGEHSWDDCAAYTALTAEQPAVGARQPDTETPTVPRQTLVDLIRDFRDPDPCQLDHHGYCQTHGWMCGGSPCPHARAREVLAAIDAEEVAVPGRSAATSTGEEQGRG